MKNICFVCFDLSILGGAERVACNVANALVDKYNVHMVSLKGGECVFSLDEKINRYSLGLEFSRARQVILPATSGLRRYYKENNIDISFFQGNYTGFICGFTSFFSKTIQVFHDHGALLNEWQYKGARRRRKLASKVNDYTFVLTEKTRNDYIERFNISKDKIFVVHNWIEEISNAAYNAKSGLIVSVGRFEEAKDFHTTLPNVAAKVKERHPDWQWHIYGDGEFFDETKEKIKELSLEDFLILKGKTNEMAKLYNDYAFLVMTSNKEGMPLVLLEAKGNGLPAVAFDVVTGPSEIIRDGVDGFLVEYPDTDAMADKICKLIEDEELRKQMSGAAKEDADRFSKETILQQWIDFIESH